jgi:hypothetical protein
MDPELVTLSWKEVHVSAMTKITLDVWLGNTTKCEVRPEGFYINDAKVSTPIYKNFASNPFITASEDWVFAEGNLMKSDRFVQLYVAFYPKQNQTVKTQSKEII